MFWLDALDVSSLSSIRAYRCARMTRYRELLELVEHALMLNWLDITSFSSSSSQLDRTLGRSSSVPVSLVLTVTKTYKWATVS